MSSFGTTIPEQTQPAAAKGGYTPYGGRDWSDGDTNSPGTSIPSGSTTYTFDCPEEVLADGLRFLFDKYDAGLVTVTDIVVNTQSNGSITVLSGGSLSPNTWAEYTHADVYPTSFEVTFQNDDSSSLSINGYELQPQLLPSGSHVHNNQS